MLTLAIETSNPTAHDGASSVALGEVASGDGSMRVLGMELLRSGPAAHDDLAAGIGRLCARAGVVPARIGRVAVSIGPGGYTALRIATATAKMISLATGARCVAVPTAVAAWWSAFWDGRRGRVGVALASKGEVAYVTVVAEGREVGAGRLMGSAEVRRLGVEVLLVDGHLPRSIREAALSAGLRVEGLSLSAEGVLRACGAGAGVEVEAEALEPIYAREPEAVTKWRVLRGGG